MGWFGLIEINYVVLWRWKIQFYLGKKLHFRVCWGEFTMESINHGRTCASCIYMNSSWVIYHFYDYYVPPTNMHIRGIISDVPCRHRIYEIFIKRNDKETFSLSLLIWKKNWLSLIRHRIVGNMCVHTWKISYFLLLLPACGVFLGLLFFFKKKGRKAAVMNIYYFCNLRSCCFKQHTHTPVRATKWKCV